MILRFLIYAGKQDRRVYEGDSVLSDNFKAGYIAAMHLDELGYPELPL